MDARRDKRQEKYRQHLGVDALLHFLPAHPHFHQDVEPVLILVSFRDLLVIHNEHRAEEEDGPEHHAQEEEAPVQGEDIRPPFRFRIQRIPRIIHRRIFLSGQFRHAFHDRPVDLCLLFIIAGQVKPVAFPDVRRSQAFRRIQRRIQCIPVIIDLTDHRHIRRHDKPRSHNIRLGHPHIERLPVHEPHIPRAAAVDRQAVFVELRFIRIQKDLIIRQFRPGAAYGVVILKRDHIDAAQGLNLANAHAGKRLVQPELIPQRKPCGLIEMKVLHILRRLPVLRQHVFRQVPVALRLPVIVRDKLHADIMRESSLHRVFRLGIHAHGGRYGDQHHGGQDADGRQSGPVALHPVHQR